VPIAAGGAPQRQVWLIPAGSIAFGGRHGDPPVVEVPGVGGDGSSPAGGGSSVDDRRTRAGTTVVSARGQRSLFQPLAPGLDPTGTRPPAGAASGTNQPEGAPSGPGTPSGGGKSPDVIPWGSGSVPPPAREPAGGSSCRAPPGSRGARDGQGLEWREAVGEGIRSEGSRSLVTVIRGSTREPSERRRRAWRSFRQRRRDDSSSSSTTNVSRSGDESAVAALLGAFRATPSPLTVRDST